MNAPPSTRAVRTYFERKKERVKGFSLGVLAKRLNMSVSNVSRILAGKRKLQFEQLDLFSAALDIDDVGSNEIRLQLIRERIGPDALKNSVAEKALVSENPPLELAPAKLHFLLEKWYYLAILELVTCKHFVYDPSWIATELGITRNIAENALQLLVERGCISQEAGRWTKNKDKIRFPDGKEKHLYNRYQKENLRKASLALNAVDDTSLKSRLVLGGTVAVNSNNIAKARAILNQAAVEALHVLCEGECDQVFQLSTILVPLTKAKG